MARQEVGEHLSQDQEMCKKNASRDAHAFVGRWGLSWKVPLSYMDHLEDGVVTKVAFIRPKHFLQYLVEKTPALLLGGCKSTAVGMSHLHAFWKNYQKMHPTHILFGEACPGRSWSNTFCLALHGDEGRGLKKGNTCVVMMESCLGLDTSLNVTRRCTTCEVDHSIAQKIRGLDKAMPDSDPAGFQVTNLKQHSFLTKFVLSVLPNDQYKDTDLLDRIGTIIVQDFHSLLTEGLVVNGQRWYGACVGMKGDLKWFQKLGGLDRAFGSQTAANKAMCHQCLAGTANLPFEDSDHHPLWKDSEFSQRPYHARSVILHVPFEDTSGNDSAAHERLFRRDLFHNTKTGVFRSFIASCVMLILRLKFFHDADGGNDRDSLLARAYSHFNLFCQATGRSPALRSFTSAFFNATRWTVYPWVNCKGSDTSLLMAWISTLTSGLMVESQNPDHVYLLKMMGSTAEAGRKLQRLTYDHGLWLTKRCAGALYHHFHKFLKGYNALAFLSLHKFQYTGFGMTAKYHLLCHEKYDLLKRLEDPETERCANPQLFGCEMNEDVVGKLSRLSRRVSTRKTSERTLQLYLIKSKSVYRRWAMNTKKKHGKSAH